MTQPHGPLLKTSDYDSAPEEDHAAFLYLEEIARERMYAVYDDDSDGSRYYPMRSEYMTRVSGLAHTYAVPGISFDPDARNFDNEYLSFLSAVDFQTTQINALQAKERRRSAVRINQKTKEKILFQLGKIRDAISKSSLSDNRRKALEKRLDEFEAELAKPASRLTPILIGASLLLGTAADVSEISDTLKSSASAILEYVGHARLIADEDEQRAIPPPPLKLSPPQNIKKVSQARPWSDDLDDDIPF
jgi:hypothetical protein